MASHQLISKYNPLRRHHQDGTTMTALPPIPRTNIQDECEEGKEDEVETQRLRRRLTSIKDFVKKQRRHMQRESSSARHCDKASGENSSPVDQVIRSSSAGTQTSSSSRSRKYAGRRDTHPKGDRLGPLKASVSKRMSYPPSEFHRQELASTSFARLRRDNSISCPMLCDCAMYEFDIDDNVNVHDLCHNSGDKIAGNIQKNENGIEKFKTSDRTNGDRLRVKSRSKNSVYSRKDESASARPPRPPSWQTRSPQQNPTEPEMKTNHNSTHSSAMLKRIGRSKSEEIGMQRTPDGSSYRPSKPPMWQTVTTTQTVQLDTDGNAESIRWAGYAKSEGAAIHKQLETASYKPPKPPSWQTVTAEPEDVAIDTSLKSTENNVPTITIPSNSSGPLAARADGRCTSAGSSRSARTPCKIQVDDDADDDDTNSPETAQASASNKSRCVRRSNIKRTRSQMIDAREIPAQEPVIPLSQTKPSEFHLRETHHDNDVYLSENVERCRQWLAGLLGDGGDTLTRTNANSQRGAAALDVDWGDDDELVTCELELTRDKWMYVGSPYPSSSSEDEDT